MKLLIDTDPGTDDALALLMALNAPDVEVVGITTVGGNATVAQTTRNVVKILEYMSRTDIPVASGAARPLRGRFHYAYDFHGRGDPGIQLPRPTLPPKPEEAVTSLAHTIQAHSGEITLAALGPLTNVAHLLQHHPDVARSLRRLVVMGGALWGAPPFRRRKASPQCRKTSMYHAFWALCATCWACMLPSSHVQSTPAQTLAETCISC